MMRWGWLLVAASSPACAATPVAMPADAGRADDAFIEYEIWADDGSVGAAVLHLSSGTGQQPIVYTQAFRLSGDGRVRALLDPLSHTLLRLDYKRTSEPSGILVQVQADATAHGYRVRSTVARRDTDDPPRTSGDSISTGALYPYMLLPPVLAQLDLAPGAVHELAVLHELGSRAMTLNADVAHGASDMSGQEVTVLVVTWTTPGNAGEVHISRDHPRWVVYSTDQASGHHFTATGPPRSECPVQNDLCTHLKW